jgi:hypothetical protein
LAHHPDVPELEENGATLAIAALTTILFFASEPATAFGLRIGPLHLGVPLFGHRHHHRPLYMHGNTNHVGRHESPSGDVGRHESPSGDVGRHESPSGAQRSVTFALLYPERALPAIFQNVFWPAYSSPWPFGYDTIFTTAFAATPADRSGNNCRQTVDANAMMERLQAEIGPTAEQMERRTNNRQSSAVARSPKALSLRKAGSAALAALPQRRSIGRSTGSTKRFNRRSSNAPRDLEAHCPTSMPRSAVARLETIEARLDATWRAILSIQVALQDFEIKLSDEQKNRFKTMIFAAE